MSEPESPLRIVDGRAVLAVWVVPGASRTEIKGTHDGALRVRVASPAESGRATRELLRFLHRRTGCRAEVVAGTASRRKTIRLDCADLASIARKLGLRQD